MSAIPKLERHCGSWIVVNRARVEAVNQDRFEVLTAAEYLGRLNEQLRECRT